MSVFTQIVARAKQTQQERREAVRIGAHAFMLRALSLAKEHVDTRRFIRALAEAGNKAGVGQYELAHVGPSKIMTRLVQILARQVLYWEGLIEVRRKEGRTSDASFRKLVKKLMAARKALDDFKEHAHAGAIVFNAFGGKRDPSVRINFKEYGGEGEMRTVAGETFVRFRIKEPHASIVNFKYGITRRALADVKSFQVKGVVRKKYIDKLKRAGFH